MYAAGTSLAVRGRSLGALQFDASPAISKCFSDASHDILQPATVRYIHLDFLLIQSQQKPFVLLSLSIHAAVIRDFSVYHCILNMSHYFDIYVHGLFFLSFQGTSFSCSFVYYILFTQYTPAWNGRIC